MDEYYEKVDQYMHGWCMYMAAALHHEYGYPIGLLTLTHSDGIERLSHCWVAMPNGKFLDVQGDQTLKQVSSFQEDAPDLNWRVYNPTTLGHLEQLAKAKLGVDEPDVQEALSVAKKFLMRELRKAA